VVSLFICLALSRHGEAFPDCHICLGLCQQRITDVLLASACPALVVSLAQRPDGHVAAASHELSRSGGGLRGDGVDVELKLLAVCFEGKVVNIVAEGIFNLSSDLGKSDDDVCGENTTGNRDPAEVVPQLEGQHHYVDPGNLRDGDGVGDGEGSLEDAVHADKCFVELDNTGDFYHISLLVKRMGNSVHTSLVLVKANLESLVVDDAVDIARNVVQDLKRQVAEGLLGTLDPLARVRLCKGDTEELSNCLDLACLRRGRDIYIGCLCESFKEFDAFTEIWVIDTRLEPQAVLYGACEGIEEVQCGSVVLCQS
jgi:hypothetical protein